MRLPKEHNKEWGIVFVAVGLMGLGLLSFGNLRTIDYLFLPLITVVNLSLGWFLLMRSYDGD